MIEHKNIHEAINAVMEEVGYVKKQKSQDVKYTFAGEAALIAALRPAMVEHGIYMHVSKIENVSREHLTTKSGTQMVNTLTTGIIRFTHSQSGTFVDSWATGEGFDSGDKSANKAMTGLYKYAMRQTFCIETGDDPDTFSAERKSPATAKPAPSVKSPQSKAEPMTLVKANFVRDANGNLYCEKTVEELQHIIDTPAAPDDKKAAAKLLIEQKGK